MSSLSEEQRLFINIYYLIDLVKFILNTLLNTDNNNNNLKIQDPNNYYL